MPVPGEIEPTAARPAAPVSFNDLLRNALPSSADKGRLLDHPNASFVYVHPPEAWEVGDVGEDSMVLPLLSIIRLSPGLNHISTRKKGEDDTAHLTLCFQNLISRGLTVINPGAEVPITVAPSLPKSATTRGYIAEYAVRDPDTKIDGTCHKELWSVPAYTPPDMKQRWEFDSGKFNLWRKHLVESGQVHAPSAKISADLLRRANARHLRRLSVGYQPEVRTIKLAESQAEIARVEAATGTTTPTAKPPRKPKAEKAKEVAA